jgi:hypothetical protein
LRNSTFFTENKCNRLKNSDLDSVKTLICQKPKTLYVIELSLKKIIEKAYPDMMMILFKSGDLN